MSDAATVNREGLHTFDLDALHRAHEERNALILASLYTEDAEIRVVDATRPPKSPLVISGEAQILEFWVDVCGRDMTHRVENEVVGRDRVAFNVACSYPDGTNVLSSQICELRDGKIERETVVQAWDT
jgi:hypothetical protein